MECTVEIISPSLPYQKKRVHKHRNIGTKRWGMKRIVDRVQPPRHKMKKKKRTRNRSGKFRSECTKEDGGQQWGGTWRMRRRGWRPFPRRAFKKLYHARSMPSLARRHSIPQLQQPERLAHSQNYTHAHRTEPRGKETSCERPPNYRINRTRRRCV